MENTGNEFTQKHTNKRLIEVAKRLKAMAQTGLLYSEDQYNLDRYSELGHLSDEMMHLLTGSPVDRISNFYLNTKEYPTPKTDIRAVIFNADKELLLVREQSDNKWSLPGGWADIGYTAAEVAVKEVAEETGLVVKPVKLLAVLDKKNHPHPPQPEYVYKLFIQCEIIGGELTTAHDISAVAFFPENKIPELSEIRVVTPQIRLMFEFLRDVNKQTVFE